MCIRDRHSAVARWGLQFLNAAPDARVLDCGCGANIKRLLKKYPQGIVKGIDYSPVSVEKSKKVNEAAEEPWTPKAACSAFFRLWRS